MDSIDDILAGVFPEAAESPVEDAPASEPTPDIAPVVEQPPVTEPVSNEAPPADDVAAEPQEQSPATTPEPEPQSPNWDDPSNPYFQQTQQYQQALQLAAQRVQAKHEAEELAMRDRIIEELPNMEPGKARQVAAQLAAWEASRGAAQVQAINSQTEPLLKELAIRRLGDQLGLTADERTKLERFDDPKVLDFNAREMVGNRKAREAEASELRQKISELQLKVQAQERLNSPVDRVAVGASAAPLNPQDATDIDEFVAALNLPTGSRWT